MTRSAGNSASNPNGNSYWLRPWSQIKTAISDDQVFRKPIDRRVAMAWDQFDFLAESERDRLAIAVFDDAHAHHQQTQGARLRTRRAGVVAGGFPADVEHGAIRGWAADDAAED